MKKQTLRGIFRKYRFFYIMLIPIALYFLVFSYTPLALGIYNSFRDVKILGDSTFIALDNYVGIFNHPYYRQAFVNTLVVNFGSFVLQFVWGLLIALLLNEMKNRVVKSAVQSITYIPNLLSWSVVGAIWMNIFAPTGMLNGLMKLFLGNDYTPITFMGETQFARTIFIFTDAWKGAGYSAILFLAAIVSIDPSIYEAASIDGASRMQQIRRIILPGIVPTMQTVAVLAMMGIMRNFDQVFVMRNSVIDEKIRNLAYLIYSQGITQFQIGPATAAATLLLAATLIISFVMRKIVGYDRAYES